METALAMIRGARRVLIAGHLRADGDCLGSESVLYHALTGLGAEVRVMNPDPPDPRYAFLHAHTPFEVWMPGAAAPPHDLLLVCDCCTLVRLGAFGALLGAGSAPRLAVDHHPIDAAERAEWTALVHDVRAPASGLLAMRIARGLGVPLPLPALEAGFAALATDTGWFRYPTADAEAWALAAELVAAGVQPATIFAAIHQQTDAARPLGLAAALAATEYHADGRLALVALSQAALAACGGTLEDTDEVLEVLRGVGRVQAVAFVHELPDGRVKASLRSKLAALDLNPLARALGGGGHARAAGVTFAAGTALADARSRLLGVLLPALGVPA